MRANLSRSTAKRFLSRGFYRGVALCPEELEERYLLAAVALVSGGPTGDASFQWQLHSTPPVVITDSSGLVQDDGAPHGNDLYYISQMENGTDATPVSVIEAYIGGGAGLQVGNSPRDFDTEFRARILAGASNSGVTNSASATVGSGGTLLYRIQSTSTSEPEGAPIDMTFQLDAILGAAQFGNPNDASGVGLHYAVAYDIYRLILVDDEVVILHLAQEQISGTANVLTGAGTFDRVERNFSVETHIGDYIALNVNLDSIVTTASHYTAQVEAFVGFDWNLGDVAAPPITITVGAQYNELGDPTSQTLNGGVPREIQISSDQFGPYLSGVELANKFTVDIGGEGSDAVGSVIWNIAGTDGTATRVGGTNKWTFTTNMGDFSAGTHELVVRALDGAGETLQEYQGQIFHTSTLNFELKVDPGSTDDALAVEDARFFQGISANLLFEGTVEGLAKFYGNKAKVYVGNTLVNAVFANTSAGNPAKFMFNFNVSAVAGSIGVDIEFGTKSMTDFGDAKELLTAVPKPAWLASAAIGYNSQTGVYEFHNYRPSLFNYSATIAKTGQKWLDTQLKKLDTFAQMEAVLSIDAPLQVIQPATFDASQLIVKAQVLGQKVADTTYSSSTLDFGGSLDSSTLDPTGLSIKLKSPALVANQTFLDRQFSFNLVDKVVPGLPEWLVSARFSLALRLMSTLTVDAGVALSKAGGTVQFVASGTFLKLAADPNAEATGQLIAKVGGGWLADFSGSATGTATLNLSTTANFSGALGAVPKVDAISLSAKFTFSYRVQIRGTLAKTVTFVSYDSAAPENGGPEDDVFGPFELLVVNTKPRKPGKSR